MKISQRLAVLMVLWLPFSIASVIAIIVTFFIVLFGTEKLQQGYGKNILRAMDKTLAALCGFDGYFTFSAECGVATSQPWIAVRAMLDKIQPGHCEAAAKNEGLAAPE